MIMKTKKLLFPLLLITAYYSLSSAQAASYRSYFGKEFTHWYVVNEMMDLVRHSNRYSVYNQDTLLNNGINYKKGYAYFSLEQINSATGYYYFGVREEPETGSLFIALDNIYDDPEYKVSEVLVSKMDLGVGDKYYFPEGMTDFNGQWHYFENVQQDEKGYFATVDSIYYKNNRKHIQFDVTYYAMGHVIPFTFIEGIGPNVSFAPLINRTSLAVCCNCYEDETGVWKSDIKNESIDYSQIEECFFAITGIPSIETDFPLKLIQRKGEIELQPDAGNFESGKVNVYSVEGKLMYSKSIHGNVKVIISTSGFSNGSYIISLTNERTKKYWSKKVVI
jgi:hypothetical protein